jgi:hypothetical protein
LKDVVAPAQRLSSGDKAELDRRPPSGLVAGEFLEENQHDATEAPAQRLSSGDVVLKVY